MEIELKNPTEADIGVFFLNQCDPEANHMAAFNSKDPFDKEAYVAKWKRLLLEPSVHMKTIWYDGRVAGTVAKYEMDSETQITYWMGKEFWGKGLATRALQEFLLLEKMRPVFGRAAFDNIGSHRVLEKCGFKKIGTDRGFANGRGKEIEEIIYRLD